MRSLTKYFNQTFLVGNGFSITFHYIRWSILSFDIAVSIVGSTRPHVNIWIHATVSYPRFWTWGIFPALLISFSFRIYKKDGTFNIIETPNLSFARFRVFREKAVRRNILCAPSFHRDLAVIETNPLWITFKARLFFV